MAQRCNIGNHNTCVACETVIDPSSDHHHVYRRRGVYQTLCTECVYLTIYAATLLLSAIDQSGERHDFKRLRELAEGGHIVIGLDTDLWLN